MHTPSPASDRISWGRFVEPDAEVKFAAWKLADAARTTAVILAVFGILGSLGFALDFYRLPPSVWQITFSARAACLVGLLGLSFALRRFYGSGSACTTSVGMVFSVGVMWGLFTYIPTALTYFAHTGQNDRFVVLPAFALVVLTLHPQAQRSLWIVAPAFWATYLAIALLSGLEPEIWIQELFSLVLITLLGATAHLWRHTQARRIYLKGVRIAAYETELRDIREKQANAAIRALALRNADFQAILESSPIFALVIDSSRIVSSCNQCANRFGFHLGQQLGVAHAEHPHAGLVRKLLEGLKAGVPWVFDYVSPSTQPSEHWTFHATPFAEQSRGETSHAGLRATLIGVNTSPYHKLRTQIHQDFQERALGSMLAGISHDLNNLLMIISGNVEILSHELQAQSEHKERIADILAATGNTTKLTQRILQFSRNQPRERTTVDLRDFLSSMEPLLRSVVGPSHELQIKTCPQDAIVLVDHSDLDQILLNFVSNAKDALTEGGAIGVQVSVDPDQVTLTVQDTGQGIAQEDLGALFSPTFTTKAGGRGQGLCTVQEIVHRLGGQIRVSSRIGQGTTFWVKLPRQPRPLRAASPASPPKIRRLDVDVLIVQTDPQLANITARMLRHAHARVYLAHRAPQAVAIARTLERLDLVLCDVQLRNARPLLLLAQLRQTHPSLAALFTTAYADDVELLLQVRREGYPMLHRPFTSQDLFVHVQDATHGPAESRGAPSPGT